MSDMENNTTVEGLIIYCVEGKIAFHDFMQRLYVDENAEELLSRSEDLPLWAKSRAINLYYFLIDGDGRDEKFISDAMQALVYYLNKRGLAFSSNALIMEEKKREILSKSLPKWLDADLSYFRYILDDGSLNDSEKICKIKELIKSDFHYINHPPRWLQSPEWKFVEGVPCIFIGELDLSPQKNRAKVYVFFDEVKKEYHLVSQAN